MEKDITKIIAFRVYGKELKKLRKDIQKKGFISYSEYIRFRLFGQNKIKRKKNSNAITLQHSSHNEPEKKYNKET